MNLHMVSSLFELFSGEHDSTRFLPLLTAAMQEVTQSLKPGAREDDTRLCYLAAAIANLRCVQLFGAREHSLATYAGAIVAPTDEGHLRFAEHMVRSYRGLCRELLRDDAFLFLSVGG